MATAEIARLSFNTTAHGPLYRRLLACPSRDDDAGKMPAVQIQDNFALSY